MSNGQTTLQFEQAGRLVGYATGNRYQMRGEFLFRGIPLTGATVLEVGCGTGAWAIWSALKGAHRVVGIDPESKGSAPGTLAAFRRTIETLGLSGQTEALACSLEELPTSDRSFDVVVMYDAINHLDEDAVVNLHRDQGAVRRYVTLLRHLRSRVHEGSWVVVADCGRDNAWRRLGLRSPLAPSIEWHKHQNPHTWVMVFAQAGFRKMDLRWSPLQPFPRLTANWLAQYLTCSHFVLRFQAASNLNSA